MTQEEQEKQLLDKIKASVSESMETKSVELKASMQEQIDALKNKPDTSEAFKNELITLAGKLKAIEEKPSQLKVGYNSLDEALKAAFAEKADEIKSIISNNGNQTKSLNLEVKTVGAISVESSIGAGSTQVSITQDSGLIAPIRTRELKYLANVSVGNISTSRALWIEETDQEGTPIMLGEGDAKTQLDVQYVEQTMSVKKIAVYGKVTTELLADIPQLISYIKNNLMRRLDIVLEDQLFSGNNVGDNLKGLDSYATAFSAGALANTISFANELDVIEAVANQVKVAYGIPNAFYIHPSTMSKIKTIKDSVGRPVWKDYVTITGDMVISGMKIIETTAITAGNFVGGDLSVVNVLNREDLGIQIGLDGNDFTQNKKTMLIEKRIVQFVSANDTAVIVDGDFATAIAALLLS